MPTTTPPWTVDGWDLAADLAKIEQQWGPVREILESPSRFDLRHPPTSGWGLGEHAGHIAITTFGIARGIEVNLASPERDRDLQRGEPAEALLRNGTLTRGVTAPERIDPKGRSREDLVGIARRAIDAWSALAERPEVIASCPARFPHFMLGHLTSADWVRFCAIHTAHHLTLVREIEANLQA